MLNTRFSAKKSEDPPAKSNKPIAAEKKISVRQTFAQKKSSFFGGPRWALNKRTREYNVMNSHSL